MAAACLKSRVHYHDNTGEVSVFEQMAARDAEARRAGVMLLPGVGFDVVPSDCLAAHLKTRLPDATHLVLGIMGLGGRISHGTATTIVENLPNGSVIRRNGKLTSVPTAAAGTYFVKVSASAYFDPSHTAYDVIIRLQ